MPNLIDLTGKRFGRLVVIRREGVMESFAAWLCHCDCGNKKTVRGISLRLGDTKSCGCLRSEVTRCRRMKHGMSDSAEFSTWKAMLGRCTNAGLPDWPRYGGRGITVCDRWNQFENFYADMGNRPPGTSLDRIDNDGPYSPENCRWATPIQQANNARSNRVIEHAGQKLTVAQWARKAGMNRRMFSRRLDRGWSMERAMTEASKR